MTRQTALAVLLIVLALALVGCAAVSEQRAGQPAGTSESGAPCRLETSQPPDDGDTPADTVIRTYQTGDGKTHTLVYGRGRGRRGDYGWAHIRNKHLYGIWYDGGPNTTYPEAGICTEEGVLDVIGETLQDGRREADGQRFLYTHPVSSTKYEILIVVGADGTIITGYPRSIEN